jgi:hypothetical protein
MGGINLPTTQNILAFGLGGFSTLATPCQSFIMDACPWKSL